MDARRYSAAMLAAVNACVPVVYVTDVPTSVAFYELLGFACQVVGQDGEWNYAYLKTDEVGLLLAAGGSVWSNDPGPVLLYLRADDVARLVAQLRAAGVPTEHLGYPDHAPGGEVKVIDPDGHVLMVGQITERRRPTGCRTRRSGRASWPGRRPRPGRGGSSRGGASSPPRAAGPVGSRPR